MMLHDLTRGERKHRATGESLSTTTKMLREYILMDAMQQFEDDYEQYMDPILGKGSKKQYFDFEFFVS